MKYRLYCEICNYSRYTDGTDLDDLKAMPRSKIISSIPKYDPQTKKIINKPPISLPKQFKCPQCGRLIRAKKIDKNEQDNDSGSETSTK